MNPPPLRCTWCPKTFPAKSKLVRHLQSHGQVLEFKCPCCSKSFGQEYSLRVHVRSHTQTKPFRCPFEDCPGACTRMSSLTVHLRQVHGVSRLATGKEKGEEDEEHSLITGTLSQPGASFFHHI